MVHPQALYLEVQVGDGTGHFLSSALDKVKRQVDKAKTRRLVIITTAAVEEQIRAEFRKTPPRANVAIVPPHRTSPPSAAPLIAGRNLTLIGPETKVKSGELAGLRWPKNLVEPSGPPGPLRILPLTAVFDPLGTAYPCTVRSLGPWIGNRRIKELGAAIVKTYPRFIRAWRRKTARARASGVLIRAVKKL